MHLQVCGGEEKGRNTRARSLTSPHRARPGGVGRGVAWPSVAWRGKAMGMGAQRAHE
jgi:hypothetical protein